MRMVRLPSTAWITSPYGSNKQAILFKISSFISALMLYIVSPDAVLMHKHLSSPSRTTKQQHEVSRVNY